MEFDNLVTFIRMHWPTVVGVFVVVAPATWVGVRWFYANRLEELAAQIRRQQIEGSGAGGTASGPQVGIEVNERTERLSAYTGNWIETKAESGATFIYRISLFNRSSEVSGTASVTKVGSPDAYEQPFAVRGIEFDSCVLLTMTSSIEASTSAVAALLRITGRGTRLEGRWVYRSRSGDAIESEIVTLRRQQ
jgi:hypothetical protein